MAAIDFKAFNALINPTDDALYIVLSRSVSGKGTPISFASAMTALSTDILAEIGVFLPPNISCIEIADYHIVQKLLKDKEQLAIMKIDEKYFIFAKEPGVKTTTGNTCVCGVEASTYGYAKSSRAILLPFKPKTNKSPRLENAECLFVPDKLGALPTILKPINKLSKPVSDMNVAYPLSADIGNILINIYQNMSKLGYASATKRETIKHINDELTLDPLTDDELENLLHANLLAKEISEFFGNSGEFLHNKMGDFLIQEMSIKRDKYSKKLYYYDETDKIYKSDNDVLLGRMTNLCPQIKEHQRTEVIKYIEAKLAETLTEFNTNPMIICFKNGCLDVTDMSFKPMDDTMLETIQIGCDYNPTATSATVDEFFKTATCGNAAIETLLYEAMGYSMLKTSELQKAFLLLGGGRNGKSTFFDLLKGILGKNNITTISFKDLATTFRASSLDGKLASIAGDISSQPVQESDLFKSITAGEDVLIEKKFEHAYEKALFSTMFFGGNALPRTADISEGFFRRFCIIPFNADLSKVTKVGGMLFKNRLLSKESIEYAAYKAVTAINNVLTTTFDFTKCDEVEEMLTQYKIMNSSVLSWYYDDKEGKLSSLLGIKTSTHYTRYKEWCSENGFKSCKSSTFVQQLKGHLDIAVNFADRFEEKTKTIFDFVPVEEDETQDELPFPVEDTTSCDENDD